MHLAPGTQVQLRLQVGLRHVQATALMRDYRAQDMSFEIVDMGMDERAKFRKLLLDNLAKEPGRKAPGAEAEERRQPSSLPEAAAPLGAKSNVVLK
jgi:hypothetical protein